MPLTATARVDILAGLIAATTPAPCGATPALIGGQETMTALKARAPDP